MNDDTLHRENREYAGTQGVSQACQEDGFQPAFQDQRTGRIELSRQRDGNPANIHMIGWLPREWAATTGKSGTIMSLKPEIVSGFVRDGIFYTREAVAGGHCSGSRRQTR